VDRAQTVSDPKSKQARLPPRPPGRSVARGNANGSPWLGGGATRPLIPWSPTNRVARGKVGR
jgi:hypothetical protein